MRCCGFRLRRARMNSLTSTPHESERQGFTLSIRYPSRSNSYRKISSFQGLVCFTTPRSQQSKLVHVGCRSMTASSQCLALQLCCKIAFGSQSLSSRRLDACLENIELFSTRYRVNYLACWCIFSNGYCTRCASQDVQATNVF